MDPASRSVTRAVMALVLLATLGAAAGYGVSLRGKPEQVRMALEASPEPAAARRVVHVHVAGAVSAPGLYRLPEGSRVQDAIDAAGGPRQDADVDAVNLASEVRDGDKVLIPLRGGGSDDGDAASSDGRVNLNTASADDLQELPGIGPALAERIVAFREDRGGFRTVRDLLEVAGIGPRTFERLEPLVTV